MSTFFILTKCKRVRARHLSLRSQNPLRDGGVFLLRDISYKSRGRVQHSGHESFDQIPMAPLSDKSSTSVICDDYTQENACMYNAKGNGKGRHSRPFHVNVIFVIS